MHRRPLRRCPPPHCAAGLFLAQPARSPDASQEYGNILIHKIDLTTGAGYGTVTTLAGGTGGVYQDTYLNDASDEIDWTIAPFTAPSGVAIEPGPDGGSFALVVPI